MSAGRVGITVAGLLFASASTGCTPLVRYTNELVQPESGRTWFTRAPAAIGGTLGFVVGIPIDVAALPVTWTVYRTQEKESRDQLSTFLFPSFVLWQVGTLVGSPFDLLEWVVWRSWNEPAITAEQRETIERQWDERGYSEYPVEVIYPAPRAPGAATPESPPK